MNSVLDLPSSFFHSDNEISPTIQIQTNRFSDQSCKLIPDSESKTRQISSSFKHRPIYFCNQFVEYTTWNP